GGAGYSPSGCRYAITSASSIARSAAARIASCNRYSGSSRPGESVKMYCVSSLVSRPTTGRRVDWGFGDTMARCSPTSALSSVDLPTFGRPASTMVPQRVMTRSVERDRILRESRLRWYDQISSWPPAVLRRPSRHRDRADPGVPLPRPASGSWVDFALAPLRPDPRCEPEFETGSQLCESRRSAGVTTPAQRP